jgi:3-oxoacyl-(acyl-carrier-protein) synthase
MITATKSLVGHALGAAGGIEAVASILMLQGGFLQPAINCEDVHPEIEPFAQWIPHQGAEMPDLKIIAKAGFGFGDVNACVIFKKWDAR